MSEKITYQGKIIEVVEITQPDGRVFEIARRSPGVRLVVADKEKQQVLLTKEERHEHGGVVDYRLPGGKVFDTLDEYNTFLTDGGDIASPALKRVIAEGREETGLDIKQAQHLYTSKAGATVVWDLLYFEITEWAERADGQALEHGESIDVVWVPFAEAKRIALEEMLEERSALVLLRYLDKNV